MTEEEENLSSRSSSPLPEVTKRKVRRFWEEDAASTGATGGAASSCSTTPRFALNKFARNAVERHSMSDFSLRRSPQSQQEEKMGTWRFMSRRLKKNARKAVGRMKASESAANPVFAADMVIEKLIESWYERSRGYDIRDNKGFGLRVTFQAFSFSCKISQ